MSAAKVSLVIAMVALLAAVAFFYQRMDHSRSSAASSQDIAKGIDEIGKGLALQQQISLLKTTLGKVATENARLRQAISELKLRKEELKVCNANLIKARRERARCDKWATDVDDEKLQKSEALKKTRLELQGEKQKSSELQTQVSQITNKLAETKSALAEIEKQKQVSVSTFRQEKDKYISLKRELSNLKAQDSNKPRQEEIEGLIKDLNKDLKQKSAVIQELTKQKRASDEMLRRLEGKLLAAGVSPSDIEKVAAREGFSEARSTGATSETSPSTSTGQETPVTSRPRKSTSVIFAMVDDNKDDSIDIEEFTKHIRPSLALRAQASADPKKWFLKRFKIFDKDESGTITREEAMQQKDLFREIFHRSTRSRFMNNSTQTTGGSPQGTGMIESYRSRIFRNFPIKMSNATGSEGGEKKSSSSSSAGNFLGGLFSSILGGGSSSNTGSTGSSSGSSGTGSGSSSTGSGSRSRSSERISSGLSRMSREGTTLSEDGSRRLNADSLTSTSSRMLRFRNRTSTSGWNSSSTGQEGALSLNATRIKRGRSGQEHSLLSASGNLRTSTSSERPKLSA
uniref:EF-hand domain-containing protein n=1 Tax=Hanusia phi TaxID=3032 RepID=A0A7S0NE77_9CRYP|mmetsp:Transcript_8002/g.18250  ORF Transcript_8002/g.18250 Transcript_8002/m.18250 type:complete len:571 (+) Transcript_8002:109-1821(+)